MASTEAQKRASLRHASKVRRFELRFSLSKPETKAILDHLDSQDNVTAYIKALIEKDMSNGQSNK